MTQNPYQQGPPPGWAQPAPQGYDPQQAPAGYPPQGPPPQQAPTPFNAPAPSGPPAWSGPDAPSGGGEAPQLHQLVGRLVFFKPLSYNPVNPKKFVDPKKPDDPTTEELLEAEIVVLDGEPIAGNLNGVTGMLTPFSTGPRSIPAWFGKIYIRGAVVPGQLKGKVPTAANPAGGLALARVVHGQATVGRPPMVLQDPTPQDEALAGQIYPMWEQLKAAAQGQIQQAAPQQAPAQAPPAAYGGAYPPQQAPQGPPPPPAAPYQPGGYPQQAPQGPPPGYPQQGPPPGYPQGYQPPY